MEKVGIRTTFGMLLLLMMAIIPLQAPTASAEIVCCQSNEFELYMIGENDGATMTPFLAEIDGINEKSVTPSIQGVEEIETWSLKDWGQTTVIPASTWVFSIDYEVENAVGVHANATVEIKIGATTYTGESGSPGTYLSQVGTISVDVEIPENMIGEIDDIDVSFSVRSMIFNQPGDDAAIRFVWGEDTDSALQVDMPLLDIEMPNAIVVGDEVFFPVILRSGFGDRMWTSLENFEFKVGGLTITDVRTPSRVTGGVEVPFVWAAGSNAVDGMRAANLSIWLNPGDVPIQAERNHDISFVEGGGGQTYEFGEPLRTAGSELNVDIKVDYDGDTISRSVEFGMTGAMAQWLRWGMDNIGNESLPQSHFFAGLDDAGIPTDLQQNGRVDTEEEEALRRYLYSTTWQLEEFIDSALALNPESLFESDLFDMNIEVKLNLNDVVGISDELISIRIDTIFELSGQERLMLITDFVRPQLNTPIWDNINLKVELTTSPLAGIYEVEAEGLDVSHYRFGIMDKVVIEANGLDSKDDFDVKYTVSANALFSPMITLLVSILLLVTAIVLGFRFTRYRSRIFVYAATPVFAGLVLFAYAFSALPPTFVMTIAGSSTLLFIPIAIVSPKRYDDQFLSEGSLDDDFEDALNREIPSVTCPACDTGNPVESNERPLRMPCGGCGKTLRIEA